MPTLSPESGYVPPSVGHVLYTHVLYVDHILSRPGYYDKDMGQMPWLSTQQTKLQASHVVGACRLAGCRLVNVKLLQPCQKPRPLPPGRLIWVLPPPALRLAPWLAYPLCLPVSRKIISAA